MKLWLLKRHREGFGITTGFVIRAVSELEARLIAAANEGNGLAVIASQWTDVSVTDCEELTPDGEAGIILADHRE